MEKIKIVYLTGFWFSGATILGRSLKSSEDVSKKKSLNIRFSDGF